MKNTLCKLITLLTTAALLLSVPLPVLAESGTGSGTPPPACLITLAENELMISASGKKGVYDVNGSGVQAGFYRYEPTNTVCIQFTDASGNTRAITLGEDIQLAVSGSFERITLYRSLGGTAFSLKPDANVEMLIVNASGPVHIFGGADTVTVYGAAHLSLQDGAVVQKLSLLSPRSSLNAAEGSRVNAVTRVPGASIGGGGSIGRVRSTQAESGGSSSSRKSNKGSSSSNDGGGSPSQDTSQPTPAPPPAVKSLSVGTQQGALAEGTAGSVTFLVTAENIADDSEVFINWENGSVPTGLTASSTKPLSGKATITMEGGTNTIAGSYPFTVTADGVTSDAAALVVGAPLVKSLSVGTQQGALTEGTAGSVTFSGHYRKCPGLLGLYLEMEGPGS